MTYEAHDVGCESCRTLLPLVSLAIDRRLPPSDQQAFEAHAAVCPRLMTEAQGIRDAVQVFAEAAVPEPSGDFDASVFRRIVEAESGRRLVLLPSSFLRAAATFLLVAGGAFLAYQAGRASAGDGSVRRPQSATKVSKLSASQIEESIQNVAALSNQAWKSSTNLAATDGSAGALSREDERTFIRAEFELPGIAAQTKYVAAVLKDASSYPGRTTVAKQVDVLASALTDLMSQLEATVAAKAPRAGEVARRIAAERNVFRAIEDLRQTGRPEARLLRPISEPMDREWSVRPTFSRADCDDYFKAKSSVLSGDLAGARKILVVFDATHPKSPITDHARFLLAVADLGGKRLGTAVTALRGLKVAGDWVSPADLVELETCVRWVCQDPAPLYRIMNPAEPGTTAVGWAKNISESYGVLKSLALKPLAAICDEEVLDRVISHVSELKADYGDQIRVRVQRAESAKRATTRSGVEPRARKAAEAAAAAEAAVVEVEVEDGLLQMLRKDARFAEIEDLSKKHFKKVLRIQSHSEIQGSGSR